MHGPQLRYGRATNDTVGSVEEIELAGRASFELEGYSHGNNPIPTIARIGNLIMTGGISGIDLATGRMPDSIEAQCANMFELAAKILETAGARLNDVIKVTVFLKPDLSRDALNIQWLRHFPDLHSRPVRHTLINPYLPGGMLVQCEMTAVKT
jgi:2-iminobutanoate/2-iminopropanoate deaminase